MSNLHKKGDAVDVLLVDNDVLSRLDDVRGCSNFMHRGRKFRMKLLKSVLQFRCVARTKWTTVTNFSLTIDNIIGVFDRKSRFVLVNDPKYVFKGKSRLSSRVLGLEEWEGRAPLMHDLCYILLLYNDIPKALLWF